MAADASTWEEARQRWPRRTARAEKVNAALGDYLKWLKRNFRLRLVILFGSYANGTFRMDSDVDLLVVADQLEGDVPTRMLRPKHIIFPARLQPFPYGPQEFIKMCEDDNAIAYSALTEGLVLQIDDGYRRQLLKTI